MILDDIRHWLVPITNNITGAFGILLCPCSLIGSPLDLFTVFRDFIPSIPFAHKAFEGEFELQHVVVPMAAYDHSAN